MTSEEVLSEKFKVLPPNLKRKAIEFVDSLQSEVVVKRNKKSLKGALAHLNIRVTEEVFGKRETRCGAVIRKIPKTKNSLWMILSLILILRVGILPTRRICRLLPKIPKFRN